MDIQKFMQGRGIDTSESPFLEGAEFYYAPPDGLYKPSAVYGEDFDYVYNRDVLNYTRFYPILLYEFLAIAKNNGQIILHFVREKKEKKIVKIIEDAKKIFRDIAKLEYQSKTEEGFVFVFTKNKSVYAKNDVISRWTFGIITRGDAEQSIAQIIKDIQSQNIPEYEIIICGTYTGKIDKNVRYIPFNINDDLGWITKKKNIICENAQYENLCIVHDHTTFEKHWYLGFQKYGNRFDAIRCQSLNKTTRLPEAKWGAWGKPYTHWMHKKWWLRTYLDLHSHYEFDPRDWTWNTGMAGDCIILKKSIWQKVPFNENLVWDQGEDYKLNKDLFERGFLIRLNPHSFVIQLKSRWENLKHPYLRARKPFCSEYLKLPKLNLVLKRHFLFTYELVILPVLKYPIKTIKAKIKNIKRMRRAKVVLSK